MNSAKSPIAIMQLGIKFNKLKEEIRKIICDSFKIEFTENKQETNQKFIRKLYELNNNDIKTIESLIEEEQQDKGKGISKKDEKMNLKTLL